MSNRSQKPRAIAPSGLRNDSLRSLREIAGLHDDHPCVVEVLSHGGIHLFRRQLAHHFLPLRVEVEVVSDAQLRDALKAGADVIMLDNMATAEMRAAVQLIREQAPAVLIEASGGVTLETVRGIAECGVDLISVGAITHSATAVDISLKIAPL